MAEVKANYDINLILTDSTHQTHGDAVDGPLVLDDHVEAELVVHDRPEAHDADVDVVRGVAHPQFRRMPHQLKK
jgi:hypothetical protein